MIEWLRKSITATCSKVYIDRLLEGWIKYGNLILAVDYDSTIKYWEHFKNVDDVTRARVLVREAQRLGAHTVIFTASAPERHEEIREDCKMWGIQVDSINRNPIPLPFGNDGSKVFYNINLCDRCGLIEAMDILEITMKKYKKHLKKHNVKKYAL